MNNFEINAIRNLYPNATFKIGILSDGKYLTASVGSNPSGYLAETIIERRKDESFEDAKRRALEDAFKMAGWNNTAITNAVIDSGKVVPTRKRRCNRSLASTVNKVVDLTNGTSEESSQMLISELLPDSSADSKTNSETVDGIVDEVDEIASEIVDSINDSESVDSGVSSESVDSGVSSESVDSGVSVESVDSGVSVDSNESIEDDSDKDMIPDSVENIEDDKLNSESVKTDNEILTETEEVKEVKEAALDAAMRQPITVGLHKGLTIAEAIQKPRGIDSIKWLAFTYAGKDIKLKKAARAVYEALQNQ